MGDKKLLIVSGDGHVSAPPMVFAEYIEHRHLGTDAIRRVLARRTPRRARHGHPAHAVSA